MLKKISGDHWLAGQWGLWGLDDINGRLPSLGFRRWATTRDNCVRPCVGEAWGSHWQWGDLRLAPWGVWLQDDCQAWAYLAQENRFFCLDFWTLESNQISAQAEIAPEQALPYLATAAAASELRRPKGRRQWQGLEVLRQAGLLNAPAAREWMIQIGSRFLADSDWHVSAAVGGTRET